MSIDLPDNIFSVGTLVLAVYIISFILGLTIIFLERKNPSATLAWLMVLFMLPGIGILLYAFLSQNISRQKIFKLNNYEHSFIGDNLKKQIYSVRNDGYRFNRPEARKWRDMILLHQSYSRSFYTQDNHISLLTDGKDKFARLFDDISKAQSTINIMYFIVKNDQMGQALISRLTERAKAGVEVRFLIDAMGSRQISHRQLEEFKDAGGKYAFFFPPRFRCFKYFSLKLNYRNHRKMVVIDGRIGYLGGFNVGNEYVGKKKKFGYWRDTHLRLTGSCVQDINARFILDWRFASGENMTLPVAYYNEVEKTGITGIQIVACGPDSQRSEVKHGYLKMISSAKKSISIQTPYFVPDISILEALRNAIFSGIDVKIMIPCMPDHMFVYWATYYYVGILLDAGARVYIYNNGFLHAKTISVDSEVASVGSANFDIRSFRLNFEANAFIYDADAVAKMDRAFEQDITHCSELTKTAYKNRSVIIRIKESFSRLLSDLL